jgi:selenocysteine-specific elongation factor
LRLFDHSKSFGLWTQVVFHLGTYEHQARVHLIDRDRLLGGETALVQIHLDNPCVVQYNDRFVIRSTSSDITFGGGEIIDPAPLRHRRRTAKVIEHLEKISKGKMGELIASEVLKRRSPLSAEEAAEILNVSTAEVETEVSQNSGEKLVPYSSEGKLYIAAREDRDKLAEKIQTLLSNHHKRHPLDEKGRTTEEMMGTFGIGRASSAEVVFRLMLEDLESNKKIKRVGNTWALGGHTVSIGEKQKSDIEFVENYLMACNLSIPLLADLAEKAGAHGIKEDEVKQILAYLVSSGKVYTHDGEHVHASHVDRARKTLLKALAGKPNGLGVAQFRDLINGNRKICLLLLGMYDSEGIVGRVGDVRVLTKKGRELAEKN